MNKFELIKRHVENESKKVALFKTVSEQSPRLIEFKLHLNTFSTLRDKIGCLRKDYYNLPADIDLTEVDRQLEQLVDRLVKI
ncbi:hypothetical protein TNCV_1747661 [Trichonephila clavipes]|nr:hypothetical protein TNCV_1747661 [Trichonephila clavipes]